MGFGNGKSEIGKSRTHAAWHSIASFAVPAAPISTPRFTTTFSARRHP